MQDWEYKPARDLDLKGVARWRSVRREAGLVEFATQAAWWAVARSYLKLAHRLRIDGREHLPATAPFVLVANHSSHLDALVLAAALPVTLRQCALPVAAGDTFFERPMMAAFAAACLNALPLWRESVGRHALEELRERLTAEPCGYILFPEGTRSRTGAMAPFKAGIGMLLAGTDVPVCPCHIHGAFAAWPAGARSPRWGAHVQVRIGPPLRFADVKSGRAGWETVANQLESAVRSLAEG